MFKIIGQNKVGLVTSWGKYTRTMNPGFNWYIPFMQKVSTISLQTFNSDQDVNVRSIDGGFATLKATAIFKINDPVVYKFEVSEPLTIMNTLIGREFRTGSQEYKLEELSKVRQDLQKRVELELQKLLLPKGIALEQLFVSDVVIGGKLKEATESVITASLHRDAAKADAEAIKMRLIAEAEANKERMILQGEGIAGMREKIAKGYEESVSTMATKLGVDSKTAMEFILNSMLMDSYKDLAAGQNSKTIFYPTSMKDAPFVWNLGKDQVPLKGDK